MSAINENKETIHCEEMCHKFNQNNSEILYSTNRKRTESEDSGISVVHAEEKLKNDENDRKILKDAKQSKLVKKLKNCVNNENLLEDNPTLKQICKNGLSAQMDKIKKTDNEQLSKEKKERKDKKSKTTHKLKKNSNKEENAVSGNDKKPNQKLDQKLDQKLKKRSTEKSRNLQAPNDLLMKNDIKSLKDVENLLSKTKRVIFIPLNLTKKLIFVSEFDKMMPLSLVEKKLNDLIINLDNVKGTLILTDKQVNHLNFVKSLELDNSKKFFNVLIELVNNQYVDSTIKKLNDLNKQLKVIKLEKCEKIRNSVDLNKEDSSDEFKASQGPRKLRSYTFSNHQTSIKMNKSNYNTKRNSLGDTSIGSGLSNQNKINNPKNGCLIRLPLGPGLNNFEMRLKE